MMEHEGMTAMKRPADMIDMIAEAPDSRAVHSAISDIISEYKRPCPFCGEYQYLEVVKVNGFHSVICNACSSMGPIAGSAGAAIRNWNKRTEEV